MAGRLRRPQTGSAAAGGRPASFYVRAAATGSICLQLTPWKTLHVILRRGSATPSGVWKGLMPIPLETPVSYAACKCILYSNELLASHRRGDGTVYYLFAPPACHPTLRVHATSAIQPGS